MPFRIGPVRTQADLEAIRVLWRTYGELYGAALGEQDLDAEAAELPKGYLEPDGMLFLAYVGGAAAGMVALQRLRGTTAVMKRLYVDELWRGRGLGKVLGQAAMDAARELGFERMVLDTTKDMVAAQRLYGRLGFQVVEDPDWASPCRAPVFMARRL